MTVKEVEPMDIEDEDEHHVVVRPVRTKISKTLLAYFMYMGLGVSSAIFGPTLVNLRELYNTDTVHISVAQSLNAGGYLLASIMCGFTFERFDSELQLSIAGLLSGISLIVAPWCQHIYGLIIAIAIQGFGMGMIDTGVNAYILTLWSGSRFKDPLFQSIHLVWSVGSTLCPIVIRPFLVEDSRNTSLVTNNMHINHSSVTPSPLIHDRNYSSYLLLKGDIDSVNLTDTVRMSDVNGGPPFDAHRDITTVRYAYMLVGSIVLITGVLFIIQYLLFGRKCLRERYTSAEDHRQLRDTNEPRCYRFGFFVLLAVFYYFFILCEAVTGSYVATYTHDKLGWDVAQGALITAAFWGAHGIGRLLGVPSSVVFSPQTMLYIDCILVCLGFITLLFAHFIGDIMVYVSVMLVGLGVSTIFPSGLLWASLYLTSTSVLASVAVTSCSLSLIMLYPLVGMLSDAVGLVWFVYVLLTASVTMFVTFIVLRVYVSARKPRDEDVMDDAVNPFNKGK